MIDEQIRTIHDQVLKYINKEMKKGLDYIPQFHLKIRNIDTEQDYDIEKLSTQLKDKDFPLISILSGKIGSGKTNFSLRLARHLIEDLHNTNYSVFWLPMRLSKFYENSPKKYIRDQLSLKPSIDPFILSNSNLKTVFIFDGIDEILAQRNELDVVNWLKIFFDELDRKSDKILLVGRNEIFGPNTLYKKLWNCLQLFCESPQVFEVKSWDYNAHRVVLDELWNEKNSKYQNSTMDTIVPPELVSSPLIFGLLYKLLSNSEEPLFDPFTNEKAITNKCIKQIFDREEQKPNNLDDDMRSLARVFIKEFSLVLCSNGKGLSGMTIDELLKNQGIKKELSPCYDQNTCSETINNRIEENLKQLFSFSLVSCDDGSYAPYHQHVMVHLAASALESICKLENKSLFNSFESKPSEKILQYWYHLECRTGIEGIKNIGSYLFNFIEHSSLNPNSDLDKVFRYWGQDKEIVPDNNEQIDFNTQNISLSQLEERDILCLSAGCMLKEAISGQMLTHFSATERSSNEHFIYIEPGFYRMWAINHDGNRILVEYELTKSLYIARNLVTISQYVDFLNHNKDKKWPQHLDNYRRNDSVNDYLEKSGEQPITGLHYNDIRDYITWYNTNKEFAKFPEIYQYLSEPVTLLPTLPWYNASCGDRLAHQAGLLETGVNDLVGTVWQFTSNISEKGNNVFVFGINPNNETISEVKEIMKTSVLYEQKSMRTTQSDTGFRTCVIDKKDQQELIEQCNIFVENIDLSHKPIPSQTTSPAPPPPPSPPSEPSYTPPMDDQEKKNMVKKLLLKGKQLDANYIKLLSEFKETEAFNVQEKPRCWTDYFNAILKNHDPAFLHDKLNQFLSSKDLSL